MRNSNFLSWVQIWAYIEHPPKMKNSNFLSWVQIWAYTEHPPPPHGSWSVWRLYPPRIPSRFYIKTRLHSSRMHTALLLTISPSMHGARGWVPGPKGCVCFGGLPGPGGSAPGGGSALGGAWSRGVCSRGDGIPACTEADAPVYRILDTR